MKDYRYYKRDTANAKHYEVEVLFGNMVSMNFACEDIEDSNEGSIVLINAYKLCQSLENEDSKILPKIYNIYLGNVFVNTDRVLYIGTKEADGEIIKR